MSQEVADNEQTDNADFEAFDPSTIPPYPEYELDSYEPVELEMPAYSVSEEQINAQIQQYAEQYGVEYVPTKRKVVGPNEDVRLDIEVSRDGKLIEALCSDDRPYTLGEGLMPEDFDKNIEGANVAETKEFDFNAPDYDDPEGADAVFHARVTVNKITRRVLPQITDSWVARYLPQYKTVANMREQIRSEMSAQMQQMTDQEINQRATSALAQRFHGAIDDYWYESMSAELQANYAQQAASQGMDMQSFLQSQGMDQNNFSMMLMMQTREVLVQGFSLDAWARHYGIEPTEEDVVEFAKVVAPQGRHEALLAQVNANPVDKENFERSARRYMASKDLVLKAKITTPEQ